MSLSALEPLQFEFLPMDKLPQTKQIIMASDSSCIGEVQEQIIKEAQKYNCDKKDIFSLRLALEEALANAVRHGNKNVLDAKVTVNFQVDEDKITICIADQGQGFDTSNLPDPTQIKNLTKPSGRGVLLMRSYMDEVVFNELGNKVTMIKKLSK